MDSPGDDLLFALGTFEDADEVPSTKRRKLSASSRIFALPDCFQKSLVASDNYLYTFSYYRSYESLLCSTTRGHYRCSKRSRQPSCKATMTVVCTSSLDGDQAYDYNFNQSTHTCGARLNDLSSSTSIIEELKRRSVVMMSANPSLSPITIAKNVIAEANKEPGMENQWFLSVTALRKHIVNLKSEKSEDYTMLIRAGELAQCSLVDRRYFFSFDHTWVHDNIAECLLGWSHPDLRFLVEKTKLHYFIDGTFKCIPTQYKQLINILAFEPRTQLYFPVFHILAQSKTEFAYTSALHLARQATGFEMNPLSITR